MNLCNYAKVILARSTKEPETLKWWNDQPNKENKILVHVPNHSQNINVRARYENYHAFMHSYPKMHIPLQEFKSRIPRLQNYLSNAKYWKNNNKTGEKSIFLEKHNLLNWCKLSEAEKKRHKKENCEKCTSEIFYASLHKYTTPSTIEVNHLCEELTKKVCENSKAKNVTKATKILHTLEPYIEAKLDMNIKETACKLYDLTKKLTSDEKQKRIHTIVSKSTERIAKILNKENEEINFLASNKSYNEYERERLHTFFESKSKAKKNLAKRFKDESERKLKKRSSVGNLSKYTFNKEEFLNELKDHPKTVPINWNEWSRKYRVKNVQGIQPANGGQVLIEFAKSQGIDVFNYNTEKRMSGRDYFRRVRRSRHLITKRLRVPVPKSAKKLNRNIKQKIENFELDIGVAIAPKVFDQNKITQDGKLETNTVKIYGRMIPMKQISKEFTKEQDNMDVFRVNTNKNKVYRHLKFWHDHSDILNRTYFSVMVQCLYDKDLYLTNEEYAEKFPERKSVDVQGLVEKPKMYIFGQSKSKDIDQLSYSKTRADDLQSLETPTISNCKTEIYDILRIFTGDNPARQFEAGHKRGGNYTCLCGIMAKNHMSIDCCLRKQTPSIQERMTILKNGVVWKDFDMETNINPFNELKKEEIETELDTRRIDIDHRKMNKKDLQDLLSETLQGIQRPPALICPSFHSNSYKLVENYEVSNCEPLHDITNVVQNLLTELPCHLEPAVVQKEYQKFFEVTIGDKNQIKGSDARLYAVKLAHFTQTKYENGLVNADLVAICNSLVEIISICYSSASQRSPRQVLRLYNQCFLFGVLVIYVIGNPKKMTSRKFYGSHFHSLVVHFPEMYRIFCLRSLIPEAEERTFGDLRNISLRTTNRQAKYIVDNCMLRLKAREKIDDDDRLDSFKRQESIISKQAHLLPQRGNTIIPAQLVTTRSTLIQAHYERISDFLVCGKHVWWQVNDGNIEFLDGPDEEEYHSSGPTLHHFSTSNLKTEYEHLNINWEKCVNKISEGNFQLPCVKVKIYKEGQLSKVVNTDLDLEEETESYEETIPSNISNGSEGSTPQDIEKQHDVNPVLNINGNPSVEKTSNHDKPPDEETIPSNSSNDSEGSAPQDIEKQHDSVNIPGKSTPDRGASSKLTINTNTIPISKNNSDPSTELMPLDHINQPHEVIQTLPIPFSSDNRCYTNDMTESLPEKQNRFKHLENEKFKLVYRSYIEDKQAKHAKESFPDQFMMGHTKGKVKKKRNVSADNKEDIDPFDVMKDGESKNKANSKLEVMTAMPVSLKMSTLELLDKVLGADTADVKTFKRYRRLVQEHSFDQSFRKSYEKAKAVVGFKLLGKFSQLKRNRDSKQKELLKQIDIQLSRWNISTQ